MHALGGACGLGSAGWVAVAAVAHLVARHIGVQRVRAEGRQRCEEGRLASAVGREAHQQRHAAGTVGVAVEELLARAAQQRRDQGRRGAAQGALQAAPDERHVAGPPHHRHLRHAGAALQVEAEVRRGQRDEVLGAQAQEERAARVEQRADRVPAAERPSSAARLLWFDPLLYKSPGTK